MAKAFNVDHVQGWEATSVKLQGPHEKNRKAKGKPKENLGGEGGREAVI